MAEQVRVSGQAVEVGSRTYAMDNIVLATVEKSANTWTGTFLLLAGVIPLVILLASGSSEALCIGPLVVVALVGLGTILHGGGLWWVYVETAQGKRKRIWSAPEPRARALADQINEAKRRGGVRIIE